MNLNPFNKDGTGLVGGKTALEYAQREGFTEIAQYLERWCVHECSYISVR